MNRSVHPIGQNFQEPAPSTIPDYSPLARIVLSKRVITEAQLNYALKVQAMAESLGKKHSLDSILYRLGFISLHTLHHLFAATVRFLDQEFGAIALEKGIVPSDAIDQALKTQAEEFKKSRLLQIGDLLREQGYLSQQHYDLIMFGYQERNKFLPSSDYPPRHADPETPDTKQDVIGMIAVEEQLLKPAQLETILEEMNQEDCDEKTNLDTILLDRKLISQEKLKDLMAATERILDRKFLAIALEKKIVTEDQVHRALAIQDKGRKKAGVRLVSDILLDNGLLTLDQCNEILQSQGRGPVDASPRSVTPKKRWVKRHLYRQLKNSVEFGKFVVKSGYITKARLREALNQLKDDLNAGKRSSLDEILVLKEWVPPDVIVRLRMMKSIEDIGITDKQFGELAMELGMLNGQDLQGAFHQQLEEFKATRKIRSISEILVIKKRLSGSDAEKIHQLILGDSAIVSPEHKRVEPPPPSKPHRYLQKWKTCRFKFQKTAYQPP
ncbi:hypothetical protein [Desulfoluna sp.]|uniref:hypothetical protein n=1 Tax=Desulfoluna sp. TaxID=2045199 RepID=UPI0026244A7B|nr:hypothetical protein [Desulfoluna sp.]